MEINWEYECYFEAQGNVEYKTKTIDNTTDPEWNEVEIRKTKNLIYLICLFVKNEGFWIRCWTIWKWFDWIRSLWWRSRQRWFHWKVNRNSFSFHKYFILSISNQSTISHQWFNWQTSYWYCKTKQILFVFFCQFLWSLVVDIERCEKRFAECLITIFPIDQAKICNWTRKIRNVVDSLQSLI